MMINRIVKECISENIPNETFLNINFPNVKDEKIGHAIETTPENSNLSITTNQVSKNEYKILLSQLQSQKSNSKDKTDMKTVKNGLVSITLLNGNNFSQHKSKNTMKRILKAANILNINKLKVFQVRLILLELLNQTRLVKFLTSLQ